MEKMIIISKCVFVTVAVFCVLLSAGLASANDTSIGDEYPGIFRGVRPLGMGNAFSAMPGTDFNAPFYNPAAINDYEEKNHYSILNQMIDFDIGVFSMLSSVFKLNSDLKKETTDSGKIRVFDSFTQAHAGEFHDVSTSMPLFQIRHRYYAASVVLNSRTVVSLRNRSFPNFEIKSTSRAGAVGGGAYGFFDDTLQVGGNLKLLYGVGVEDQITSRDIVSESLGNMIGWSRWKKGFGAGVDIGTKYALPFAREILRPTLSLVIQDVANTRFTGGAQKIPMSVTAGAGIFPEVGGVKIAVLTDFREINQRIDILKKFHFGVEARFPEVVHTVFSVRAGTNQGYPACGFTAEWPIVAFNFAFYGEEEGEFNHSKVDYRFVGQLAFGF